MLRRALYFGAVLPLAMALAWVLSWGFPKVRAAFGHRRGVWTRLERLAARRDAKKPLLWFHVASAGEFLQMEPLLHRARDRGLQVAVTVTSVSGLRWLERIAFWPETVWADLLPLDGNRAARRLYDALRPSVVLYVQADLWPGLIWEGSKREIPQVLLAARLNVRSARVRSALLRWFYRDLYRRLAVILAGTEADLAALRRLMPGHPALRLGGDPGMETVLRRLDEAELPAYAPATVDAPVLVAGSTWPPDEEVVRGAYTVLRERIPALRLILAPHEPTEERLKGLETLFAAEGTQRLGTLQTGGRGAARVLLVDRVGKLAGLYRLGTVAYVGGAFTTGVHNVAEPAAARLPVFFGPRYHNSAAARALLEREWAAVVPDATALAGAVEALLKSPDRRATVGNHARAQIERMASAAQVSWDAVAATLSFSAARP